MRVDSRREVVLTGGIEHETSNAYLIDFGEDEPVWIPKSQIIRRDKTGMGDLWDFTVPEWLAEEKDLL